MNITDQPDITTPRPVSISGTVASPTPYPTPEPTTLRPIPQSDTEPPITQTTPVAIEILETKPPLPSAKVPEEHWSLEQDIVMTTQPPQEPVTLEPIDPEAGEYTREPLTEPPWFPKLYVCIDAKHYDATGDIRVLSAIGNTLSVDTYRPRDFGQLWFTNFKGYVKNASTNGLLSSTNECDGLRLSDTVDGAGLWDFRNTGREREYDIVAQCGRKLHVPLQSVDVTLDPVGTSWFMIPVARVQL